ncbi:MAG TPA: MEDS domain-containing protein [Chloroflexia bacterium]|nr:MEDS domain-containing protein [Chloroflexia bacterium]
MTTAWRPTGIGPLGDKPWATHVGLFYETEQDLLDVEIPYFQAGLAQGEACLWVVNAPLTQEAARTALRQAVPDLDRYLADNSIEILADDAWYRPGGVFDLHHVINGWQEKLDGALARGYAGLRVSGDTAWVQAKDWRDFREYEKELDVAVANQRLLMLCTFPLAAASAAEILDMTRTHQQTIVRRHGNWEIVETPELRQAKAEIQRLNDKLEQRVVERTRELAAANDELRREVAARQQTEAAEREERVLAEALSDTVAVLNSTLDFEEVLDRILENVGRVVAHDVSTIALLDQDIWRVVRHRGFAERGLAEWIESRRASSAQRPVLQRMIETGEPLVVPDTQTDPGWVFAPQIDWIRSWLSTPIRIKGAIIGVLNLHSSVPGFFTPAQATRLQAFVDQAGIALENARLLQAVQSGHERLQTLSQQLLIAQETERRSIARELHDEIGQVLTAVGANLRVIELSRDRVTRAQRLEESLRLVDDALKRVRDLALELRPSLLDDFGLGPALEWYVARLADRSGFAATVIAEPAELRLPPSLETTCYRIAQIALTNVVRHAQAQHVRVGLSQQGAELTLVIRDDGVGFDVPAALDRASQGATMGLLSMQERVRLAGGHLAIQSTPGQGTEIRARFPIV